MGTDLGRQAAIGRAVLRLIELGLEEELVRPGLEALARYVLGDVGADPGEETRERRLFAGGGQQLWPP